MSDPKKIEFTFTWRAIELLGKGLYSNPWAAISELVANSIDAEAKNVWIIIKKEDESSIIEIIDDGIGMTLNDLNTYAIVGNNRRSMAINSSSASQPKGRKGIGKLAALFLSKKYYVSTKTNHDGKSESTWLMDVHTTAPRAEDRPHLLKVSNKNELPDNQTWSSLTSGTRILLTNVDLTGYGEKAIDSLEECIANQFTSEQLQKTNIFVISNMGNRQKEKTTIQKNIAYNNFLHVLFINNLPTFINDKNATVKLPVGRRDVTIKESPSTHEYYKIDLDDEFLSTVNEINTTSLTYKNIPIEITGWIAIHATIKDKYARDNDSRFIKNRFYNPCQLRVYVRGKLASSDLLHKLGITHSYLNYIEGEVEFNLLDEDTLPDIATASREGFDETDDRFNLLKGIARKAVRTLIRKREDIVSHLNQIANEEEKKNNAIARRNTLAILERNLDNIPELQAESKDRILTRTHNCFIQNDIGSDHLKPKYSLFLSHAKKDKLFSDFIFELLCEFGVKENEIFYTSRTGGSENPNYRENLTKLIRETIIDTNTIVLYLTSDNFKASEYCMFEGGAGWATCSIDKILKLPTDFGSIPKILEDGRKVFCIFPEDGGLEEFTNNPTLTPELHNYLINSIVIPILEHINLGRRDGNTIPVPEPCSTPRNIELYSSGYEADHYFLPEVVKCWKINVENAIAKNKCNDNI